jgi:hypothetical protein
MHAALGRTCRQEYRNGNQTMPHTAARKRASEATTTLFRVGLYDPLDDDSPVRFVGRPLMRSELSEAAAEIERYHQQTARGKAALVAGIFPIEADDGDSRSGPQTTGP